MWQPEDGNQWFILDAHGHLGPFAHCHQDQAELGDIIRVLDRYHVRAFCVSASLAVECDAAAGNRLVAEAVKAYPDRVIGQTVVNPHQSKDIKQELDLGLTERGMPMVKIHPSYHRCALTDPRYEPVWEHSCRTGFPVLVHTWHDCPYSDPRQLAAVAAKYPSISLIAGHSGGTPAGIRNCVALAKDLSSLYLDLAMSQIYRGQVEYMVEELGSKRILFSSDLPFIDYRPQLARVTCASITSQAKADILGLNMRRLLLAGAEKNPVSGMPRPLLEMLRRG